MNSTPTLLVATGLMNPGVTTFGVTLPVGDNALIITNQPLPGQNNLFQNYVSSPNVPETTVNFSVGNAPSGLSFFTSSAIGNNSGQNVTLNIFVSAQRLSTTLSISNVDSISSGNLSMFGGSFTLPQTLFLPTYNSTGTSQTIITVEGFSFQGAHLFTQTAPYVGSSPITITASSDSNTVSVDNGANTTNLTSLNNEDSKTTTLVTNTTLTDLTLNIPLVQNLSTEHHKSRKLSIVIGNTIQAVINDINNPSISGTVIFKFTGTEHLTLSHSRNGNNSLIVNVTQGAGIIDCVEECKRICGNKCNSHNDKFICDK